MAEITRRAPSIGAASFSLSAEAIDTSPDLSARGRAAAVYAQVFHLFEAQIQAIQRDQGLSVYQREAAVLALRQRQQIEAKTARRRVLEEERQRVSALRRRAKSAGRSRRAPKLAR